MRAVLALFDGPLAAVRFPQVDKESLAEQIAVVEQRRAELQRALEAVQAARAGLEQEQRSLLDLARRAHAYASVFAVGDAQLSEQLTAIEFDGRPPAPAKKRGRKPKQRPAQPSLTDRQPIEPTELAEDAA
ncbi:MAG TPA: hypothetical protein VK034_03210 [Enhygromyxa sp.]|nr:hypothetical protein [Enhygromyxa sp.]